VAHRTKHHPSSSHPSPDDQTSSKFISLGIETLKAISPVTRIESIVFSMSFLPKHDAVVLAIVQVGSSDRFETSFVRSVDGRRVFLRPIWI
jgi:hypothetical protein